MIEGEQVAAALEFGERCIENVVEQQDSKVQIPALEHFFFLFMKGRVGRDGSHSSTCMRKLA
jgi:hypothetical protein